MYTIGAPGSQSGLQLRLNIEQYEYMKGPNTGAGIKLHLHDQGDVALVRDQGIAVAPGTHGFVAVDLLKVKLTTNAAEQSNIAGSLLPAAVFWGHLRHSHFLCFPAERSRSQDLKDCNSLKVHL